MVTKRIVVDASWLERVAERVSKALPWVDVDRAFGSVHGVDVRRELREVVDETTQRVTRCDGVSTSTRDGIVIGKWELFTIEEQLNAALLNLSNGECVRCHQELLKMQREIGFLRQRVPNGKVSFEGNEDGGEGAQSDG